MPPRRRRKLGIVLTILLGPFLYLKRQLMYWTAGNGKRGRSRGSRILKWVLSPFTLLLSGLTSLWRLLVLWWDSTDGRSLVRGMPALIIFVLAGYTIASGFAKPKSAFVNSYMASADAAYRKGDFDTARLLYDRLVSNGEKSPDILYKLAVSSEKTGDRQRAGTLIAAIAPDNSPGYADAQVARARQYLTSPNLIVAKRIERARTHLEQALASDADNMIAHELLARIDASERRWSDAIDHLEIVIDKRPDLLIQMAIVQTANNNRDAGRRYANQASVYFSKVVSEQPENIDARMRLAESLTFIQQFKQARQVLKDGLLYEDSRKLKEAISKVYVTESDSLPSETLEQRKVQFDLLSQAVQTETRDLRLFDRLMSILNGQDEVAQEARAFLNQNIVDGRETALAHLLLGTVAGGEGDFKNSVFHLQQAQRLDPNMTIVGNNLAWYLAEKPEPDLQQAMKIIEGVLQVSPRALPHFFDTRGFIHQKLGNYESALVDYERALPGMKNDPGIHERLGRLYERLNQTALAKQHKDRAAELWESFRKDNNLGTAN